MADFDQLKWEYLILTVAYVESDDGGQVKLVNGAELPGWRERNWRLPNALAYYGEQGWELASTVWRTTTNNVSRDTLYIMKRPRPA